MAGEVLERLERYVRIDTEWPGLMWPVLKLPLRVAVWAVPLVLEKVTFDPAAIVSVGGW